MINNCHLSVLWSKVSSLIQSLQKQVQNRNTYFPSLSCNISQFSKWLSKWKYFVLNLTSTLRIRICFDALVLRSVKRKPVTYQTMTSSMLCHVTQELATLFLLSSHHWGYSNSTDPPKFPLSKHWVNKSALAHSNPITSQAHTEHSANVLSETNHPILSFKL